MSTTGEEKVEMNRRKEKRDDGDDDDDSENRERKSPSNEGFLYLVF